MTKGSFFCALTANKLGRRKRRSPWGSIIIPPPPLLTKEKAPHKSLQAWKLDTTLHLTDFSKVTKTFIISDDLSIYGLWDNDAIRQLYWFHHNNYNNDDHNNHHHHNGPYSTSSTANDTGIQCHQIICNATCSIPISELVTYSVTSMWLFTLQKFSIFGQKVTAEKKIQIIKKGTSDLFFELFFDDKAQ